MRAPDNPQFTRRLRGCPVPGTGVRTRPRESTSVRKQHTARGRWICSSAAVRPHLEVFRSGRDPAMPAHQLHASPLLPPPAVPPVTAPNPRPTDSPPPPVTAAVCTTVCAAGVLAGWLLSGSPASLPFFVVAYLAGGAWPAASAVPGLLRGRLGVDLLMILAALGAAVLGDWVEGAVLLFLFSLSGTLEAYATYRTAHSIESLMHLRP